MGEKKGKEHSVRNAGIMDILANRNLWRCNFIIPLFFMIFLLYGIIRKVLQYSDKNWKLFSGIENSIYSERSYK